MDERTALDEAFEAARQDPKQAAFFYDSLLNAMLYLPVKKEGESSGKWRALGRADCFHPFFLRLDATKVVPVFDRLERLKFWAETQDFDYLEIKGHLLIGMLSADVAMQLNLGTPYTYYLSPQILERLREAMRPVTPS